MKWLRENAAVLTLAGALLVGLWVIFVEHGTLAKKNEVEVLEKVLKSGLLELAKCVDNPQYVLGSDPEHPVPSCETKVYRAFDDVPDVEGR